jgi:hypothetical protein
MSELATKFQNAVHAGGAALGASLALVLALVAALGLGLAQACLWLSGYIDAETQQLTKRVWRELP